MIDTLSLIDKIRNAPEYVVIGLGNDRQENVEAAYSFYRSMEGGPTFSLDLNVKICLDFMGIVWDTGREYYKFTKNLMDDIGLGETVIGPSKITAVIGLSNSDALRFFNITNAVMNFKTTASDCEKFVQWRCKQSTKITKQEIEF